MELQYIDNLYLYLYLCDAELLIKVIVYSMHKMCLAFHFHYLILPLNCNIAMQEP